MSSPIRSFERRLAGPERHFSKALAVERTTMPLDPALQLALRTRPTGYPVMRQSWRDLTFLHFPCDPQEIAPLLPPGLSVDTFPDAQGIERAWIGLVPFLMRDVRWAFTPSVPGTHTFLETNVRTYVHFDGTGPGVWFFSLDAANSLAVRIARAAFALPYFHARMSFVRAGEHLEYCGERSQVSYSLETTVGAEIPSPAPGSLEFFLVERYLLYAFRRGHLLSGRVFHPPYTLQQVSAGHEEESLVAAAGIAPRPFLHRVFSAGVDVEVFPLRLLR